MSNLQILEIIGKIEHAHTFAKANALLGVDCITDPVHSSC
jgi:hypothetical protein